MAEAVLSGENTFSAQDYTESFFASVPSDERFISCSYQKFPPESSIDGKTIVFVLSRYQASNIYLIQVILCLFKYWAYLGQQSAVAHCLQP